MPLDAAGEAAALTALLNGRYLGLHTGDPTGGNEVAGGSYARQAAGTFSQTGNDPTTASNDGAIAFPTATADWGSIEWFGIWSAVSGGDLIAYEEVDVIKIILNGDIARWPIGSITVTAD